VNAVARAWSNLVGWWLGDYIRGAGAPVPADQWCTSGEGVSIQAALSLPAVARGVAVYSDAVASLPRRVVKRVAGGGVELDESSDAARLLASVGYFDIEGIAASAVSYGNGYGVLSRNQRGGVESLAWIDTPRVTPALDERQRLFYRISADYALSERERLVPASDVLHLKFRASGAHSRHLGVSPLATCGPALAMALRAREFQNEILVNVKSPAVYLAAPGKISPDTAARLKTEWDTNFGRGSRGKTGVLGEGLKPEILDLSTAVDAELHKQFEFGVAEVARALGVPVSLLAQPGAVNYAQAVEETRSFAALSLEPFCRRFANELGAKLLTPAMRAEGFEIEFDLARLLVSPGEVAERMSKLVNGGVMTVNESRNELGLPDVAGGDEIRCPVNTQRMSLWLVAEPAAQTARADQAIEEAAAIPALRIAS
jgi:HK97 family phage portal protein